MPFSRNPRLSSSTISVFPPNLEAIATNVRGVDNYGGYWIGTQIQCFNIMTAVFSDVGISLTYQSGPWTGSRVNSTSG
jgi:hypothetical protein